MFDSDWVDAPKRKTPALPAAASRFDRRGVSRTSLLHWQEHCLECAPPQCYRSCQLYEARRDGHCRRFTFGIAREPRLAGLFDEGADLQFRRWAKLEARLGGRSVSVASHRLLDRLDRGAASLARRASDALAGLRRGPLPSRLWASLRRRALALASRGRGMDERFDAFVLECHSCDDEPFQLLLEIDNDPGVVLRHGFRIEPGPNLHVMPADQMNLAAVRPGAAIRVYPANDRESRLVFTWLDFVVRRSSAALPAGSERLPAPKVKCVAWDLDNTLWRGILAESAADDLELRGDAVALIRGLDERGILQTIVSKNDHDEALAVVRSLGLEEYFLHPAINWGQKSKNLEQVATALNIGIDTFALIDDAEFERSEVKSALPEVRVYPDTEIPRLLEREEFGVPITETSRMRRESYRGNIQREQAQARFDGDYEDFLRSCGMKMRLFVPSEEADLARCLEMLQRTNQLNLSTRRYDRAEFEALRARPGMLCVAFACSDRFGDYGTVGFASVDEASEPPVLLDFVLSCRVAQKRVEHTFFQWLAERQQRRGRERLRADLMRTAKNGPLFRVFDETPFECIEASGERRLLELQVSRPVVPEPVIELHSDVPEPG